MDVEKHLKIIILELITALDVREVIGQKNSLNQLELKT